MRSFVRFSFFLDEGLGGAIVKDLVLTSAYELDCVWLLRWLTVEAYYEIFYEECEFYVEQMGLDVRYEHALLMEEMTRSNYLSDSSFHPSKDEVEYLDDLVDPMGILPILLPPPAHP